MKVNKISTAGIEADVYMTIKNPNRIGFTIYESEFSVTYSGIPLGKARLLKRVHIKGRTEETYAFTISNSFKNIGLSDVLKLLGDVNFTNTLKVDGWLQVGKFLLKKKNSVHLEENPGGKN